jgi:hypothetical protein
MAVIPLTLTISLCLVATFVLFFLRESAHRAFSSAEHDSLLPLADEMATTRDSRARETTAGAILRRRLRLLLRRIPVRSPHPLRCLPPCAGPRHSQLRRGHRERAFLG